MPLRADSGSCTFCAEKSRRVRTVISDITLLGRRFTAGETYKVCREHELALLNEIARSGEGGPFPALTRLISRAKKPRQARLAANQSMV